MAKLLICLPMEMSTPGIMPLASLMELVFTNGRIIVYTQVNSKMASRMDMENGKNAKTKRNAIAMKDNMNLTRKMAKEPSYGNPEMCMLEHMSMMKDMAMERCHGLMGRDIRVSGLKESSKEREL